MKEIAAALLAAQKALPAIHKDSKADTGKFSYTYLSLAGLLEAVLPVLNANGLALSQVPTFSSEGAQVLKSSLIHESGEALESETPLILAGAQTPQTWGGAVTYARRYALTALLGIAADEDDDGAAASRPQKSAAKKETGSNGKASQAQVAMIHATINDLAKDRAGGDTEVVRNALKDKLGIESMADLSKENGTKAIQILAEWKGKATA